MTQSGDEQDHDHQARADHYVEELAESLELRSVAPEDARDILARVERQLAQTNEDPYDAFGQPGAYARRFAPAFALAGYWMLLIVSVLLAVGGGLLITQGILGLVGSTPLAWGLNPWAGIAGGVGVLVIWILLLVRAANQDHMVQRLLLAIVTNVTEFFR